MLFVKESKHEVLNFLDKYFKILTLLLFDKMYYFKGETFEVPEIVPFRLTHNMVNGMGPMGTEGLFRRACEVTMRLMRDQREPLMR